MDNYLIDFESVDWINTSEGFRHKEISRGNKRIRLLELSEGFTEKDWCMKGHIGCVLEGSFKIDFNGHILSYIKGNVLWIDSGETNKHKAIIEKDTVLLILFEEI